MKRGIQSVAVVIGMLFTLPGLCQAPSAPPPEAPGPQVDTSAPVLDRSARLKEIDAELAAQARRRSGAKGGLIAAGVVLGVGIIASAVQTADNAEEAEQEAYENGESEYEVKTAWGGFLVGALIATPIALASINTMRDTNRRTQDLNRERMRMRLGDAGGTPTLTLAFDF
jgi:hypothetical protein